MSKFRNVKFALIAILFVFSIENLIAQKATWIWYPGDYDIWLGNKVQCRRTERGTFFPPFWKVDSHYVLIEFSKTIDLVTNDTIKLTVEGRYNVKLDGKLLPGTPEKVIIPAGKHSINIKVYNQTSVPAIFVDGRTVHSDNSWLVTFEDKEWIDQSGRASDNSTGTLYQKAASWNFCSSENLPSQYRLATKPIAVLSSEKKKSGVLYDFGKETFGYPRFHGLIGSGTLNIYYGESSEEAMSTDHCETLDRLPVKNNMASDLTVSDSKAFRYIYVEKENSLNYDSLSMLYEYLPLENRGSFRCSDELINSIWDMSAYTLQLTTREFFIDGIKRDRWMWSGDAYQSYLMNYYLFFDTPAVSRTTFVLRGKDPVTSHINTIMDYTFYWFMGIYDYYQYTGDKLLIEQLYSRMKSMMDFCLSRRNKDGMMEGMPGDWVFIDWADFKMSKIGEVSFEQLLFCRSLETMALCANIMKDSDNARQYSDLASDLRSKIFTAFWSENENAFIHNREKGVRSSQVTPFANIFAVLFNYLDQSKTKAVKTNVLLNPNALKISTPYMRFYELESLCIVGEKEKVLKEIRDYWGGMINLGATSFWEKFNPAEKNPDFLAMYGRPYGKSLCHAWGASPVYLLGKYFLGVKPVTPGYETYSVEPFLGDMEWIEGDVPAPGGKIHLYCNTKEIRLKSDTGTGSLRFRSLSRPVCKTAMVKETGGNTYEIIIPKGKEIVVKYRKYD